MREWVPFAQFVPEDVHIGRFLIRHDDLGTVGGERVLMLDDERVEIRDSAAGVILFNAAAVLIAAAEVADPQEIALVFAAVPGSGVFSERGFQVASPAQLNEPLSEPHLHTLTADARRVVRLTRDARERDAVRRSGCRARPVAPLWVDASWCKA